MRSGRGATHLALLRGDEATRRGRVSLFRPARRCYLRRDCKRHPQRLLTGTRAIMLGRPRGRCLCCKVESCLSRLGCAELEEGAHISLWLEDFAGCVMLLSRYEIATPAHMYVKCACTVLHVSSSYFAQQISLFHVRTGIMVTKTRFH